MTRCPLCHHRIADGAATVALIADQDDTAPHPATVPAHATCWRAVEAEDLLDAEGLIPVCIRDLIWESVSDYSAAEVAALLAGLDPREVSDFRERWGLSDNDKGGET